jgi:hypothetical protein
MVTTECYLKYKNLLRLGFTSKQISKELGVSKSTIDKWRLKTNIVRYESQDIIPTLEINNIKDFYNALSFYNKNDTIENNKIYSFLLGLYLGDGYISVLPRCIKISYSMDIKYSDMNNFIILCLTKLFGKTPCIHDCRDFKKPSNCMKIELYDKNLKTIFPHHGIGAKHLRQIQLTPWQNEIIDPGNFIKGLVYSDGAYIVRNTTGQKSYEIVNASLDIINIASKYLHELNIHHNIKERTSKISHHAKIYKITIYGKLNVEKLHDIIGDKYNIKK